MIEGNHSVQHPFLLMALLQNTSQLLGLKPFHRTCSHHCPRELLGILRDPLTEPTGYLAQLLVMMSGNVFVLISVGLQLTRANDPDRLGSSSFSVGCAFRSQWGFGQLDASIWLEAISLAFVLHLTQSAFGMLYSAGAHLLAISICFQSTKPANSTQTIFFLSWPFIFYFTC